MNKDIDIFNTLKKAERAFNKSKVPCHLLMETRFNTYFVDRSKTAIIAWPNLYTLIKEK